MPRLPRTAVAVRKLPGATAIVITPAPEEERPAEQLESWRGPEGWRGLVDWPEREEGLRRRFCQLWTWRLHVGAFLVLRPREGEGRPVFVEVLADATDTSGGNALEDVPSSRVRVYVAGAEPREEVIPNVLALRYVADTDVLGPGARSTFGDKWLEGSRSAMAPYIPPALATNCVRGRAAPAATSASTATATTAPLAEPEPETPATTAAETTTATTARQQLSLF